LNALTVDPKTGFLQSSDSFWSAFSAEKKITFIERVNQIQKETGKWPNFAALCDEIGINPRTLERHLKIDEVFAGAFKDALLKAKWKMESGIYDLSGKNAMYALIWLRKWFPSEYNPEYKGNITVDVNVIGALTDRAKALDAEIISSPEGIDKSI